MKKIFQIFALGLVGIGLASPSFADPNVSIPECRVVNTSDGKPYSLDIYIESYNTPLTSDNSFSSYRMCRDKIIFKEKLVYKMGHALVIDQDSDEGKAACEDNDNATECKPYLHIVSNPGINENVLDMTGINIGLDGEKERFGITIEEGFVLIENLTIKVDSKELIPYTIKNETSSSQLRAISFVNRQGEELITLQNVEFDDTGKIKLADEENPPQTAPDADQDGIADEEDNCKDVPNLDQKDFDSDGKGDLCDDDSDGDEVNDDIDNCAPVKNDDGVLIGNIADTANPDQSDLDTDGMGDVCDPDMDGDQIPEDASLEACSGGNTENCRDNCSIMSNPNQEDEDNDGVGNACDNCPSVPNTDQIDSDENGIGNACDGISSDVDDDQIPDIVDNCPEIENTDQLDTDEDSIGDVCDTDDDGDGISDVDEASIGTDPLKADSDEDGFAEGPGVFGDNCPMIANEDQADADQDGIGDACDNCPNVSNLDQLDDDQDGIGNLCSLDQEPEQEQEPEPEVESPDTDEDGVVDLEDNCVLVSNADQLDDDDDQIGNACDPDVPTADTDNDGIMNQDDNCLTVANPDQTDEDADGIGDACDLETVVTTGGGNETSSSGCTLTQRSRASQSMTWIILSSLVLIWILKRRSLVKN